MSTDPIPEAVYLDAAREYTRLLAEVPGFRAAVESAYRAGHNQDGGDDERPAEIWVDRRRYSGQPCIYGTRLPVLTLVRYADACGDAAALEAYPWATAEDLAACRAFLAEWKPINDDEPDPGTEEERDVG